MYKYVYVKVCPSSYFFGAQFIEHRETIDKYAKKGYRYVGYIPTQMNSYGNHQEIDLIFEIEENKTMEDSK